MKSLSVFCLGESSVRFTLSKTLGAAILKPIPKDFLKAFILFLRPTLPMRPLSRMRNAERSGGPSGTSDLRGLLNFIVHSDVFCQVQCQLDIGSCIFLV